MYKKNVLENAKRVRTISSVVLWTFFILAGICFFLILVASNNPNLFDISILEIFIYAVICAFTGLTIYALFQVLADISVSLVLTDEEKLKEVTDKEKQTTE